LGVGNKLGIYISISMFDTRDLNWMGVVDRNKEITYIIYKYWKIMIIQFIAHQNAWRLYKKALGDYNENIKIRI